MKPTLIILLCATVLLWGCWCNTAECIKAQSDADIARQQVINERLKIQSQIEANKPTEVRVQEAKNEDISVWEWLATAAAVWWWLYIFSKILDM